MSSSTVSTKLQQIAEQARRYPRCAYSGTAQTAVPETPGSLSVLLHLGQLSPTGLVALFRRTSVAVLVEPPQSTWFYHLGDVRAAARDVSAAQARAGLLDLSLRGSKCCAPGDGVVLRLPKNRMKELFTSGSVGGPAGNRRPYPTGLEVLLEQPCYQFSFSQATAFLVSRVASSSEAHFIKSSVFETSSKPIFSGSSGASRWYRSRNNLWHW